jgi:hypothetical protein
VPPGANFGYDVLVCIGKALFLKHRNVQEVVVELREKNIDISPREVSYLGKKFITYLAMAHGQCSDRIKEAMQLRGGYVFHLDGTCEGQEPLLMSGLDSLSEIVLANVKLPSEKMENVIPFLKKVKERYGNPIALVHDMGAGILKAVEDVFPKVPDFVCHFHFLRDIGKDLLLSEYDTIRNRLRTHGITAKLHYRAKRLKQSIDENPDMVDVFHHSFQEGGLPESSLELIPTVNTYSLILWALDGKNQGHGYGFPFDRPHLSFVKRLQELYLHIDRFKDIELRRNWRDNKPYYKILHDLKKVMKDTILWNAVEKTKSKIEIFDKLRDAMRIAPVTGRKGLNHDGMDTNIKTVEKNITKFRDWIALKNKNSPCQDYKKMIEQIDKYWDKLFADPIVVDTPSGKVQVQPQRTNNILEQFFRDFKRGCRRRTGSTSLGQVLRTMLAETPLVKNLENPQYMNALLGKKASLEELFAEIEIAKIRKELREAQHSAERVPTKIRRIIAEPKYPEKVADILSSAAH